MYLFAKIKRIGDIKIIKMLYFSFVQSILQYGIIAWGSACKTTLETLRRSHNIILRIILSKDRMYSSALLYKEFEVFDITQLYLYKMLHFMNKSEISNTVSRVETNTRQAGSALALPVHKTIIKKHFVYLSPILLNKLPENLTNIPPILIKKHLKRLFIDFINTEDYLSIKNNYLC